MQLQRVFSLILLVTYGVPAMVGSSWHCHVGCEHVSCDYGICDDVTQHEAASCCCGMSASSHIDVHDTRDVEEDGSGSGFGRSGHSGSGSSTSAQATGEHGPCAICAFYAHAAWSGVETDASLPNGVATTVSLKAAAIFESLYGLPAARGPPSC